MDKKVLFNEALVALVEFAATKNNNITIEDVKLHFKGLIDDDSQYQFIYDYLAINKINVDGAVYTSAESIFESDDNTTVISDNSNTDMSPNSEESEEELYMIKMYMDEMKEISPISPDEKISLISKLINGDTSVVEKIIDSCLPLVAEIAEQYRGKGVSFGDLIQEGNMELLLSISDYTAQSGDFDSFIKDRITHALNQIINSQINSGRIGQRLADKLNQLDSVTKNLSEKLGRVPELSEIAQAMGITEDDASVLLKTSLDTLSVNEDTQITSDDDTVNPADTGEKSDPLQWRVNNRK